MKDHLCLKEFIIKCESILKGRAGGWVVSGKGGKVSGDWQCQCIGGWRVCWGCAGDALAWERADCVGSRDGKNLGLPACVLQWYHRLLEASSLLSALSAPSLSEAGSVDLHLPPTGLSCCFISAFLQCAPRSSWAMSPLCGEVFVKARGCEVAAGVGGLSESC